MVIIVLPPIAVEKLLVEDCSVGAEEGDWVHVVGVDGVGEAHVVTLAVHLGVGVVASENESVTRE